MPPELLVTGALNWDTNLFVKRLPQRGEEVVVEKIERVPGGKGGNVSVAAAKLLGPGKVALMACLGRDEVGRRQIEILQNEGVDTGAIQILDGVESGQAFVTVEESGHNVVETHFGANARLTEEHLASNAVQSVINDCSTMVVIDPPRKLAGSILARARRLGKSVLWHPGVLTRFGVEEFESDMVGIDYLVLNEHESASFTGKHDLDESMARLSKAAPKAKVLITLGDRGAAFCEQGKTSKLESVSLEKLNKTIVNTTGSGDAFVGTFAAYKILGRNDFEALRYASMAGALKATRPETRGSPGRKELEEAHREYFR
jgi:ribokinase